MSRTYVEMAEQFIKENNVTHLLSLLRSVPYILTYRDVYGYTLLGIATVLNKCEIIRILVDIGSPTRGLMSNDYPWLVLALHESQDDTIRHILKWCDTNERDPIESYPPLTWAVHLNRSTVISDLITAGADLFATDGEIAWTALHWAAYLGHVAVVRELIAAGRGALVRMKDATGEDSADIAMQYEHAQIASLLRQSWND